MRTQVKVHIARGQSKANSLYKNGKKVEDAKQMAARATKLNFSPGAFVRRRMMRFAASTPRYVPDHTKSARKAVDDASSLSYMRRGIFHHCNPLIAANAPCMTWWGQTPGTCAHTSDLR